MQYVCLCVCVYAHWPPFSTAGESLYLTLGIEKDATPEEIKKAYRKVQQIDSKAPYC